MDQSYYMFNLGKSVEESTAERPEWIDLPRLLIPLLESSHWTLMYVDFVNKTTSYFNSIERIHNDSDRRIYWKDRVLNTLDNVPFKWIPKQRIGDVGKWVDNYVQIPYQNDGYNCGVFMLYFAQQLMNNKRIITSFDPTSYRKYLQEMLLMKSMCMKNKCLICGKDEGSFRENYSGQTVEDCTMVQCEFCTRWFHILCLPEIEKNQIENQNWICGLCSVQCSSC